MRIHGYAALFGVPDLEGDVIHAGAFRDALARGTPVPMLVRHEARLVAGAWRTLHEDVRGLFVEGQIDPQTRAGALARRLVGEGVDGLSIGFHARLARSRPGGGRDLFVLDLVEISIVPRPMAPRARFARAPEPKCARSTRAHNHTHERTLHA